MGDELRKGQVREPTVQVVGFARTVEVRARESGLQRGTLVLHFSHAGRIDSHTYARPAELGERYQALLAMALATFDRQEVDRFARAFEELLYRDDAVTMASFYAQDATILAPDSEAVQGRHAIEEFWKATCEAAHRMAMKRTIKVQHMERSGDLGYVVSTVTLEIPAGDDQPITNTYNEVTVWKTDADSGWRVVVDSINRTAPLQTPPLRSGT